MIDPDDQWRPVISALLKRVETLEAAAQVPEDVYEFLRGMKPCDECGIVFRDRDAWGAHVCVGRQGR